MKNTNTSTKYGDILKSIRNNKNMTQAQLSDKTGIASAYISRIERNEIEPKISTLLKIKKALGVSGNEILGEMDNTLSGILRSKFEKVSKLNDEYIDHLIKNIDFMLAEKQLDDALEERNNNKINFAKYEYEELQEKNKYNKEIEEIENENRIRKIREAQEIELYEAREKEREDFKNEIIKEIRREIKG
jgi:transcriptional regulator with XRE-family HTH domain